MTWLARGVVTMIRGYQLLLGPFMGGGCRFHPSCSSYAIEAFETHGALAGLRLVIRRVSRCHPLASPGIDPVPPRPTSV